MSYPDVTVVELQLSPLPREDLTRTPGTVPGRQNTRKRAVDPLADLAVRLQRRKGIVEYKRRLSAYSLLVAGLGIGLMMASMELSLAGTYPPLVLITVSVSSTVSTVLLLGLILAYHMRDIQLFMIDEGVEEWRVALTRKRKLSVTLELLVCAAHPFPLAFPGTSDPILSNTAIVLSNVMFLRVYLVQRVIFMYSEVLNPSYRTIGSLNRINLRFHFVLKILMNSCPGKILFLLIFLIWFVASWMLSLCERQRCLNSTLNFIASMWLIPITFFTIGYGDMVPDSTCGKFICLMIGVTGVTCTALFIAVIAKKMELSKDEKHVHNFMQDIQLVKEVQKTAADLIRVAWLLYKQKKNRNVHKIRKYQRDVLSAICGFRRAKLRQRKLHDQVNTMMDVSKMQLLLNDMNSRMVDSYNELEKKLGGLVTKVDGLALGFEELPSLVCEAFSECSNCSRSARSLSRPGTQRANPEGLDQLNNDRKIIYE
ncbi:intermediate conductance calcium-activated potassium channel protein 4-like [Heterodontus francisci]|uniref:intermediate conductance calcium-activated potassium channel protein 4-like n=1 Tax=Heterodontus francisci TaxID=7792 RepID=UPI00355BF0A0